MLRDKSYEHVFELFDADITDINDLCRIVGVDPTSALRNADLSGCDLTRARLNGFDLSHANLTNANLAEAEAFLCDLSSANVSVQALSSMLLPELAIWPTAFLTSSPASTPELSVARVQKIMTTARRLYDRLNLPNKMYSEAPSEDRYELAVAIDSRSVPTIAVEFFDYILNMPLVPGHLDLDAPMAWPDSTVYAEIVRGIRWMRKNPITSEHIYGVRPPNDDFKELPPFFWREKLKLGVYEIENMLFSGRFVEARNNLDQLTRLAQDHNAAQWPRAEIFCLKQLLSFIEGSPDLLIDAVHGANLHLPEALHLETIGFLVWMSYLSSIHLSSDELRAATLELLSTYGEKFWQGAVRIADDASAVLSGLPGYWELRP